jgi:hypothetical protein
MKKIIGVLIIFIIFLAIGFGIQLASIDQSYNLWLFQIDIFDYSFKIIDFLIISTAMSLLTMIILSIFIFVNRKKLEKLQKIRYAYGERYQQMLLSYLMVIQGYPNDVSRIEKEHLRDFKRLANTRYKRQLLLDTFADVNLNLKGEPSLHLKELFFKLKLHKMTFKKVHSIHWHKKIKGFKELYAMNITRKNNILYKYINSRNELVRMEAQIALVDLSKEDPKANAFDFLSKLKTPFSLWEQITLHQVLVQRDLKVPDFGQWVLSENDSVCMFCLRMIREYEQVYNIEKIKSLLYHNNDAVKKLAIQVIGDLKLVDLVKFLKLRYKYEETENDLEIIKSIGKLQDHSSIRFLQLVIDKEDSANFQIEAAKAIHNMGEQGELALNKMLTSNYKDYNIIIKHVLDHRIV